MKKKIYLLVALLLSTTSCKDYLTPSRPTGMPTGPVNKGDLPDQPSLDAKACEYLDPQIDEPSQKMVWALVVKSQCPKIVDLRYQMTALRNSLGQLCGGGGSRAQRDLEYHFEGAVSALQFLLGNPFGPLRQDSARLSMEIYSWPNYNRFALNYEILKAHQLGSGYSFNSAPSRKGFAAIEALIANVNGVLAPGPSGQLREEERAFNELGKSERLAARCRVLSAMIEDASVRVEELFRSVHAREGRYPEWLLERMRKGESQMVLNEVSDGLFYLEKVKDFKLGVPLGLSPRCVQDKCPEQMEFPHGDLGLLALRQNLEGFRMAMAGVEHAPGFEQLLRNVHRGDVAEKLSQQIEHAMTLLAEVEEAGSFRDQLAQLNKSECTADAAQGPTLCRLYFELKSLTALFKSDFLTALNLQPPRTDADND